MLNNYYPTSVHLSYEEFQDVFCEILPEEKPYFELLQSHKPGLDHFADVFECLAAFIIFSGEELQ